MIKFLKKNFIIGIGVLEAIIILMFLFIESKSFLKMTNYVFLYSGVIIFVVWLNDKRYKFLYFFFFNLLSMFIVFILSEILRAIAFEIVDSRKSLIVFLAILYIFLNTISQILYNFFKKMSYKKNSEKLN